MAGERYERQVKLPEIGVEGQRLLAQARVLIVGAGGLGSPAALYLAAAGTGTLGISEFDSVSVTNLHRQILYATPDVGRSKAATALRRLSEMNPEIRVEADTAPLTSANALDLIRRYDIVLDGTDNFPARYLINDACALLGKPYVFGSVFKFEGQVTLFDAARGPCYRCFMPEPPPPGTVPDCGEAGVLGVVPGIIGTLQALEAIKWITKRGTLLDGRMILFDALDGRFREIRISKNRECPLCGRHPTITQLIDYEEFCSPSSGIHGDRLNVTAQELSALLRSGGQIFLLDVRDREEHEAGHIGGVLIPLRELPGRLGELPEGADIVAYCQSGSRSARAVELLRGSGFPRARNLAGGMEAWMRNIGPLRR